MIAYHFIVRFLYFCIVIIASVFLNSSVISLASATNTPQIWSMTPDISTATQTEIRFHVQFSTPVSGVDIDDFAVAGSTTSRVTDVKFLHDSAHYEVTVQHSHQTGKILLTLVDNDTIVDAKHVPLGGVGISNGNAVSAAYTIAPVSADTALHTPKSGSIDVGQRPSIALTSTDIPVISYYDASNADLKLTFCESPACLVPTIRTIDSTGDVGQYSALRLSKTGIPHIAYYDATNGNLKLAICKNALCTSSTISVIDDATADVGRFVNMELTSKGIPIISYYDVTNTALKVLHCGNTTCKQNTRTISTLTSSDGTGYANAMVLTRLRVGNSTPLDRPRISFYDRTNNLKLYMCADEKCTAGTVETVGAATSNGQRAFTSIDVNSENLPVISYINNSGELIIATCTSVTFSPHPACASFSFSTLTFSDISHTSLKLANDDSPIIAMVDYTLPYLSVRACEGATCGFMFDYSPNIFYGLFPAVALNSINLPITAYYNDNTDSINIHIPSPIVDDGTLPRFAKTMPLHNSTLTKPLAKLTWQAPTGATNHTYEYCIATSIAACANATWTSVGTATSVNVTLSPSTTYFWQVRVINPANITESIGGYWSFRTK